MSAKLRVGVVGLGIGFSHVGAFRALPERYDVVAVCDTDEGKRGLATGLLGIPAAHERFEDLLARGDLDVVDVCTPPHLHVPMARAALASGRHVICEKPLAGSLADVDALVRAEADAPGHLMPIFQYRFGRGFRRLQRLVERDLVGRSYLHTVETAWTRGPAYYAVPWRGKFASELGGVCVGHAIHAHDLLYAVAGPARSVHARLATRVNPIETEDCAVVSLEMADGSLASLAATLGSAREISRMRLCFENLTAENGLAAYTPGSEPWTFSPRTPEVGAAIEDALRGFDPGPEQFAGQFAALHAALAAGEAPPVTVADARASLELVTAIYHSAETGAPVALPLGADHPKYEGWLPADGTIPRPGDLR